MKTTIAIRLSRTPEVERTLQMVRKRFPALDDPEIFKLALSQLATADVDQSTRELNAAAAAVWNVDGYLEDPAEDIYHLGMGKKVRLSAKQ